MPPLGSCCQFNKDRVQPQVDLLLLNGGNAAQLHGRCSPKTFRTFLARSQGPGEEHADLEEQEIRTRQVSVCEEEQIEGGHKDVGEAVIQMARMAGETESLKEGRRIWDPCNTAQSPGQNGVQIHEC